MVTENTVKLIECYDNKQSSRHRPEMAEMDEASAIVPVRTSTWELAVS